MATEVDVLARALADFNVVARYSEFKLKSEREIALKKNCIVEISPCFTIRTPLFNSFLISIAGTRTFNSPLNLNRTKRFLFLMFSSNAILTTLSPLPSTERKRSLVFTLNGILSHLGNTRLTSSAHSLIAVFEFVHHPVCYSLL